MRCSNWEAVPPSFDGCCCSTTNDQHFPSFEKISEGFTAIRMVEGGKLAPPRSPPPPSARTPSHPYSWDTPVFVWGEQSEEHAQEESEVRYVKCNTCTQTN